MGRQRPLSSEERLEITETLRRGNLSHHEIAKRFGRAQSTISKLARDAGITPTHRRKRSPKAKDPETTYSKAERVAFEDRIIGVLDSMVEGGGLTPKDMREVSQAAKVMLDARRAEDIEPEKSGETEECTSDPLSRINLEEMFAEWDRLHEEADRLDGPDGRAG